MKIFRGNGYKDSELYRELFRRRAIKTVIYMWNIARSNMSTIQEVLNATNAHRWPEELKLMVRSMKKFLKDSTLYILANLRKIENMDDLTIHRKEILNRLSTVVQTRIKTLQNPPDCTSAKLLLVDVSWPCGYGCHVHYLMFCLNMAYATGRTLILQSMAANAGRWWTESYLPFSDKCSTDDIKGDEVIIDMNHENFNGSARVMRCIFKFYTHAQNVSVAPPAVPNDLASILLTLHSFPAVWFLGQLAQYLLRPTPRFRSQLGELALSSVLSVKNDTPVVDVHVRRTDKWPHELKIRRQIYLASDDPTVFNDVKAQYPHYLVHNTTAEKFVSKAGTMYPTDGRTRIAMEIFLLSSTDFIVCTLSSNVCRLAYELMQARHDLLGDASDLVQTIDTTYFWNNGQSITYQMAQDEEDKNLHRGNVVDVWSGHLNAAFERQRLKNKIYYVDPSYKCIPRVIVADMKGCSKQ